MKIFVNSIMCFLLMFSTLLFMGSHSHILEEANIQTVIYSKIPNNNNHTQFPSVIPEEKKEIEEKLSEKENKKNNTFNIYFSNNNIEKRLKDHDYQLPLNSVGFSAIHSSFILIWICCFLM